MAQIIDKIVRSECQPRSTGVLWLDTTTNEVKSYTNGEWKSIAGSSEGGKTTDPLILTLSEELSEEFSDMGSVTITDSETIKQVTGGLSIQDILNTFPYGPNCIYVIMKIGGVPTLASITSFYFCDGSGVVYMDYISSICTYTVSMYITEEGPTLIIEVIAD